MMTRSNAYLFFTFFAGIAVVGMAVFTVIIAATHTISPSDFPVYVRAEYIDRSESMTFTSDGGAQLYEAEEALSCGGAKTANNAMASAGKVVGCSESGDGVSFYVRSDDTVFARLFLSLGYMPSSGTDVAAGELFSLRYNGAEAGIRTAVVHSCGSPYDFRENELCTVELKAGDNEITLEAKSAGFTVDYMVLVPAAERTSSDPVIGVPEQPLESEGEVRRFEAEKAANDGAIPYADDSASGGFRMRFFAEGASVAFYPHSDASFTASFSVALRCPGSSARASDLCRLYVNGVETRMYSVGTGISDDFVVMHIADVAFGTGVNEVRLVRRSGVFDIDYAEMERIEIPPPEDMIPVPVVPADP